MRRALGRAESFLDRSPDSLSTRERTQLLGKWIALQRYTPATIPVRLIAAVGDAPGDGPVGLDGEGFQLGLEDDVAQAWRGEHGQQRRGRAVDPTRVPGTSLEPVAVEPVLHDELTRGVPELRGWFVEAILQALDKLETAKLDIGMGTARFTLPKA